MIRENSESFTPRIFHGYTVLPKPVAISGFLNRRGPFWEFAPTSVGGL